MRDGVLQRLDHHHTVEDEAFRGMAERGLDELYGDAKLAGLEIDQGQVAGLGVDHRDITAHAGQGEGQLPVTGAIFEDSRATPYVQRPQQGARGLQHLAYQAGFARLVHGRSPAWSGGWRAGGGAAVIVGARRLAGDAAEQMADALDIDRAERIDAGQWRQLGRQGQVRQGQAANVGVGQWIGLRRRDEQFEFVDAADFGESGHDSACTGLGGGGSDPVAGSDTTHGTILKIQFRNNSRRIGRGIALCGLDIKTGVIYG